MLVVAEQTLPNPGSKFYVDILTGDGPGGGHELLGHVDTRGVPDRARSLGRDYSSLGERLGDPPSFSEGKRFSSAAATILDIAGQSTESLLVVADGRTYQQHRLATAIVTAAYDEAREHGEPAPRTQKPPIVVAIDDLLPEEQSPAADDYLFRSSLWMERMGDDPGPPEDIEATVPSVLPLVALSLKRARMEHQSRAGRFELHKAQMQEVAGMFDATGGVDLRAGFGASFPDTGRQVVVSHISQASRTEQHFPGLFGLTS